MTSSQTKAASRKVSWVRVKPVAASMASTSARVSGSKFTRTRNAIVPTAAVTTAPQTMARVSRRTLVATSVVTSHPPAVVAMLTRCPDERVGLVAPCVRAGQRRDAHRQPVTRDDQAWSSGNEVRAIVHGRPYFAELHARICAMERGDLLLFTDWRGDPDQQLTDDPASTLSATLVAACERGVVVRGLLWRSHWRRLGYHSHKHRYLGEDIGDAGGQCLRDMRIRALGSHHQKLVVLRYVDRPEDDIAYLGGIDLCHGRRDDGDHAGDPQAVDGMSPAYGPTPAWHDVHVAIQGPAVHDAETTFRERWDDSVPLTVNPVRRTTSWLQQEDVHPEPLPEQQPPPPPRPDGTRARPDPADLPAPHAPGLRLRP